MDFCSYLLCIFHSLMVKPGFPYNFFTCSLTPDLKCSQLSNKWLSCVRFKTTLFKKNVMNKCIYYSFGLQSLQFSFRKGRFQNVKSWFSCTFTARKLLLFHLRQLFIYRNSRIKGLSGSSISVLLFLQTPMHKASHFFLRFKIPH